MRLAIVAATAFVSHALLTGCASRSTAATEGTASDPVLASASDAGADRQARCEVVADSVRATTRLENLRVAVPRGRLPIVFPSSLPAGEVRTTFLVDPMGRAVAGTLVVTGTSDASFRSQMEDAVLGAMFRPPMVGGCPMWGRGDIRITATRSRVR